MPTWRSLPSPASPATGTPASRSSALALVGGIENRLDRFGLACRQPADEPAQYLGSVRRGVEQFADPSHGEVGFVDGRFVGERPTRRCAHDQTLGLQPGQDRGDAGVRVAGVEPIVDLPRAAAALRRPTARATRRSRERRQVVVSFTSSRGCRPFANDLKYTSTSCSCFGVGALPPPDSLCLASTPRRLALLALAICARRSPLSSASRRARSRPTTRCCPATPPTAPRSTDGAHSDHLGVRQCGTARHDDGHADRRHRCTQRVGRVDAWTCRRHRGRDPTSRVAARGRLVALAPRRARRASDHRSRRLHDHGACAIHSRHVRDHVARGRGDRPDRLPSRRRSTWHRSMTVMACTRRRRSFAGSCATARIWRSWRSSESCSPAPTSGPAPARTRCCDACSAGH